MNLQEIPGDLLANALLGLLNHGYNHLWILKEVIVDINIFIYCIDVLSSLITRHYQ